MKLTYKSQLLLSCGIILVFNILNTIFHHWILSSIGWWLCGLLWIIHPVGTKNMEPTKKNLLTIRLAGVFLVIVGLVVHFNF